MRKKTAINPPELVAPLGRYSHAVKMDIGDRSLIFVAGQIALDRNGKVVAEGDAAKQAEFVFEEIETVLRASEATLDDVVKTTIFVTDMSQFPKVAEVRNRYFRDDPPASTAVEIGRLARPGCIVEIEAVAVIDGNRG